MNTHPDRQLILYQVRTIAVPRRSQLQLLSRQTQLSCVALAEVRGF